MASPAEFAAKCQRMATVVPRAQKAANEQAARAIKPAWYAAAGLGPGSKVAGRKVSIGDTTKGTANVTTLVKWQGPVHLVNNPTVSHLIAARRLGSRNANRKLTGRLSAGSGLNRAFGGAGANRGSFGSLRSATTNGRRGPRAFNGKKALTIGGSHPWAYAFHPGTKGKKFWQRNVADANRIATTVYKASALPSMLREAGFT